MSLLLLFLSILITNGWGDFVSEKFVKKYILTKIGSIMFQINHSFLNPKVKLFEFLLPHCMSCKSTAQT